MLSSHKNFQTKGAGVAVVEPLKFISESAVIYRIYSAVHPEQSPFSITRNSPDIISTFTLIYCITPWKLFITKRLRQVPLMISDSAGFNVFLRQHIPE